MEVDEHSFREMLNELDTLREQVRRLQSDMTRMLTVQRNQNLSCQVSEFHHKFGFAVRLTPQQISNQDWQFRTWLLAEAVFEVFEVIDLGVRPLLHDARTLVMSWISSAPAHAAARRPVCLPSLAKEMADVDYVMEGFRKTIGIPRVPVALAVHASNMAMERDSERQPMKQPGWVAPDIAGILRSYGWRG